MTSQVTNEGSVILQHFINRVCLIQIYLQISICFIKELLFAVSKLVKHAIIHLLVEQCSNQSSRNANYNEVAEHHFGCNTNISKRHS